jgi:hypothetical protein
MSADRPTPPPDATDTPRGWRRIAPVLALLALAPWAAESSWGGNTLGGSLLVVLVLAPLYGGAAVLIRETARRTGGGWPAIVLLAAAFGTFQAGLVDQSLFNRDYLADTQYADQAAASAATLVPLLGFSAEQAVDFIGNHIVLSICVPIAIVESFLAPARRNRPWLGRLGLVVVAVLYLLGSLLIFTDSGGSFLASPVQLTVAALVMLALVGAAALPRWRRRRPPVARPTPRPIWVALLVLGANVGTWFTSGWAGVGVRLVAVAVVAVVVVAWSRRAGWGQRHVLAAWSASLVTAAAGAYFVPTYEPASPAAALIGDIAISVITVALVGGAIWRLRAHDRAAAQATPVAG